MNLTRLGCLSPTAILATLITSVVIAGFSFFTGAGLFNAGGLNAHSGESIGGVTSHAATGNNCASCHPAPWAAEKMDDLCKTCHVDIVSQLANPTSVHGLMMKSNLLKCRDCHDEHHGPEAPLTNMTASGFPHVSTGYSLASHRKRSDGRAFACIDCHTVDVTRFDQAICSTCHKQIDSAFLAVHTQSYGTDCRGCHDGRETISKNFDHSQAIFKLDGKHAGVACEKCHVNAHTKTDFKTASTACSACHLKDDTHKGSFGKECSTCHNSSGWKPSTFDHMRSSFKLDGAHARVTCEKCHINNIYKGTSAACFACHQKDDTHSGKFGQDCSLCHKTSAWKPATFDHNLSAFKLTGAHITVACEKCHINNVFKGTAQACSGCHADPAFHAGLFRGQACSTCHTSLSWSPAQFNLAHPEPINGGEGGTGIRHGGATCRDCHTVNLMTATCTKCHDGNPGSGDGGGGGGDD